MSDAASGAQPAADTGDATAAASCSTGVPLRSLAPSYVESQHQTYLRRLNEVVADPRNRNIAITGRYGTGKSSILDQFQETHKKETLRLAISTLGPDSDGDSKTNRIQKELVKQLIYSASPKTLRGSTFSRWAPLSWKRAVGEATVIVGVTVVLLALLGVLPDIAGAGDDEPWLQRAALWVLLAAVVIAIVAALRVFTYGRFVSDVSAAGATVSLSERTLTYFDKYLDEIVNFFDAQAPDYVVFEDLDRFGDPHIFEGLRELNTLLNNTPKRVAKGTPLRFIYAVRDSLFEKLGSDTEAEGDDAARAETVRANRTKFFDVVIPVVPFISHRNARDLLRQLLADAKITEVDRSLVDLVSQHSTDMRLLVNMRNEYLVFAERLLEGGKQAPGLTPTGLFALVAYKNFHLGDFEDISRRGSDLDVLYRFRRELVRSCVLRAGRDQRNLLKGRGRAHAKAGLAATLGARLAAIGETVKAEAGYTGSGYFLHIVVGSNGFALEQVTTVPFWEAVAEAGQVDLQVTSTPGRNGQHLVWLRSAQIDVLFPEAVDAERWAQIDEDEVQAELARLDRDVAFLQGADFGDLAGADEFKHTGGHDSAEDENDNGIEDDGSDNDGSDNDGSDNDNEGTSFGQLVETTMKSDLARALVKRGYLDRNYALYAAQFYGDFAGVDVATFVVQNVQTNTMEIDYKFTSPGAVRNLLSEAGEGFTRTVSAYNVAVVDYLLENRSELAKNVVDRLVTGYDAQAREFLGAYLTTGKSRPLLVHRLSVHGWRDTFTYLTSSDDVPDDIRVSLVDAALQGADTTHTYNLDGDVAEFIGEHYKQMQTFTAAQDDDRIQVVVTILEGVNVLISNLAKVHTTLQARLVRENLYQLTAPNLRAALDTANPISLDHARESDDVYAYCLAEPARYLAAVASDENTPYTVEGPGTLRAVLHDVAESWSEGHVDELVAAAAPGSELERLGDIPPSTWPALAAARLFRASLVNLEVYRAQIGSIDEHLAHLLLDAGRIDVDDDTEELENAESVDKVAAAVAILNADDTIEQATDRVALVDSLSLEGPVPVAQLQPQGGELLTLLITAGIVEDSEATFSHFHAAGWSAFEPAIAVSEYFAGSISPAIIDGMAGHVFGSRAVRDKIGTQVVQRLGEFVTDTDSEALLAAAKFAVERGIALPHDQIRRVAATGPGAGGATVRLLQLVLPTPTAEIVATLTALGEPYSNLSTRQETEFEVPYDDAHRAVFGHMEEAGLCRTSKKRSKDILIVKLV
ncbi:hypothetical protein [Cellulosimicrobium cellulans]|uniref:YobI family P-loop NTPase n=1 Tax=Cellulosimicrobium cellulans TaxID=1710 RepID=UPI0038132C08